MNKSLKLYDVELKKATGDIKPSLDDQLSFYRESKRAFLID